MKTLSAREIQVAELLAWGYSDKEQCGKGNARSVQ